MSITASPGTDPRTSNGRTLPQLLRDRARENAGRDFMREKRHGVWRGHSWEDVLRNVAGLAHGLAELGFARGDLIAIASENIVESFWIEYAALALGGRVVFAYPDLTPEELFFVLDHSEARLFVAEDQEQVDKYLSIADRLPKLNKTIYIEDRGLWHYDHARLAPYASLLESGTSRAAADPGFFDREVDLGDQDDVAAICYTSGTTGLPKGVMLSHRFLVDGAYRIMAAHRIRAGAAYLSYISPAWATEQFMGFALGLLAPMVLNFAEKPDTVQSDLREVGPEYLLFTPRQWEMLASGVQARMLDAGPLRQKLYEWAVRAGRLGRNARASLLARRLALPLAETLVLRRIRDNLGLSRANVVLSGGSGLSPELFHLYHALGVSLRNIYGTTELGVLSSHWEGEFDPSTMGELLPSDPTISRPIEAWIDEAGQLRIRCTAFSGYLKNEEATAELGCCEEGYRTGDAVRVDERGQLVFLDRLKDLRRLGNGQAFPPQFIENSLRASPFIKDAMVLGDERRAFVAALINIDAQIAGRLAERQGLAYGTFPELSQLPEVRGEVGRAIRDVNRRLDPGARVASFATLPKELDPDEAELTRSRKLRRPQIAERYRDIIEAIYAGEESCTAGIRVQYQDGRVMDMVAEVAVNRIEEAT